MTFGFHRQSVADVRNLTVTNVGGSPLEFRASASTNRGGSWLSLSPGSGQAAPGAEPLARTVNEVAVEIGGVAAPVSFSGLTPELVGLYQVNVTVPAGVAPGDEVPLRLIVAGQAGPVTMIAVQ